MKVRVSVEHDEKVVRAGGARIVAGRRVHPDFSVGAEGHARESDRCYFAIRGSLLRNEPAFAWSLWHRRYGKRLHRHVRAVERKGHFVRVQRIQSRDFSARWPGGRFTTKEYVNRKSFFICQLPYQTSVSGK